MQAIGSYSLGSQVFMVELGCDGDFEMVDLQTEEWASFP